MKQYRDKGVLQQEVWCDMQACSGVVLVLVLFCGKFLLDEFVLQQLFLSHRWLQDFQSLAEVLSTEREGSVL